MPRCVCCARIFFCGFLLSYKQSEIWCELLLRSYPLFVIFHDAPRNSKWAIKFVGRFLDTASVTKWHWNSARGPSLDECNIFCFLKCLNKVTGNFHFSDAGNRKSKFISNRNRLNLSKKDIWLKKVIKITGFPTKCPQALLAPLAAFSRIF